MINFQAINKHDFSLNNEAINITNIKNIYGSNIDCDGYTIGGEKEMNNNPFESYYLHNCSAYKEKCKHLNISILGLNEKDQGIKLRGEDMILIYYDFLLFGKELFSRSSETSNDDILSSIPDLSYIQIIIAPIIDSISDPKK